MAEEEGRGGEEKVKVTFVARTANFTRDLATITTSMIKVKNNVEAIGRKIESITKKIATRMIITGGAVGVGLGVAAKGAVDFETEMRNVNSLIGLSENKFAKLNKQTLDLATRLPASAESLAKSAYNIVSSGFGSPAEVGLISEDAVKASRAGLTSADVAGKALVTTLNAYALSALDSTRVSDALFQTVNKGQLTFEELAINLGDFVGISSAAGASMEETLGVYAKITTATGQPSQAATNVQAIFSTLINQSEPLQAALKKTYGSINITGLITKNGLLPILRTLYEQTNGNASALQKLFPNVEAVRGILGLFGKGADDAAKFLESFTDEAKISGITAETLARQAKSVSYTMDQLKSTVGAVRIQFGQAFLPALKLVVSILQSFAKAMAAIPQPIKNVMAVMAAGSTATLILGGAFILLKLKTQLLISALRILFATKAGVWLQDFIGQLPIIGNLIARLGLRIVALQAAAKTMILGFAGFGLAAVAAGFAFNALMDKMHPKKVMETALAFQEVGDAMDNAFLKKKYGSDFSRLAKDIKKMFPSGGALGRIKENFFGTIKNPGRLLPFGSASELKGAENVIKSMDEGLASLYQNGDAKQAAARYTEVTTALKAQGVTTQQVELAFKEYNKVLDTAALQAGGTAAQERDLAKKLQAVSEEAERAGQAYTKYISDRVSPAKDQAIQVFSFETVTAGADKAKSESEDLISSQKELRDITKDIASANRDITEALEDQKRVVREATLDKMKANKKLNRLKYVTGGMAPVGSDAWIEQQETQLDIEGADKKIADAGKGVSDARQKLVELTDRQTEANKRLVESQNGLKVSIAEIALALQKQITDFDNLQKNLLILAQAKLPLTYLDQLKKMGPEGASIAQALVDATPEERQKIVALATDAATRQTDTYTEKLDQGLVIAAAVAKVGAAAGIDAILAEVHRLAPGIDLDTAKVKKAMEAMGLVIDTSLAARIPYFKNLQDMASATGKTLADVPDWIRGVFGLSSSATQPPAPTASVSVPMVSSTKAPNTTAPAPKPLPGETLEQYRKRVAGMPNSTYRSNAQGGVDTQAHIQKSPNVLYGERSTGGEAFIPRKGSRTQAARTLATAADWHNFRLTPMALGGSWGPPGRSQSVGGGTTHISRKVEQNFLGDIVTNDVNSFLAYADQKRRLASLQGADV